MLQRDMRAATCRGVQPATSARSRAGRCLSSSRTTLQEPERQATSHSIWGLYMQRNGGGVALTAMPDLGWFCKFSLE